MLSESFKDTSTVLHVFFDPVVGLDKSGHQKHDIVNQASWDDHNAFQRIAEHNVALEVAVSGAEWQINFTVVCSLEIPLRRRLRPECCEHKLLLLLQCQR